MVATHPSTNTIFASAVGGAGGKQSSNTVNREQVKCVREREGGRERRREGGRVGGRKGRRVRGREGGCEGESEGGRKGEREGGREGG